MRTPEEVIAEARRWIGYHEGPNNDTIFGREYGLNGEPWCDMFLTHCFKVARMPEERFASTQADVAWHRQRGTFDRIPRVGDKIFFHWPNSSRASNQPDHVGLVIAVNSDGSITTIEGNIGDRVQMLVRRANILGYAHPRYDKAVAASTPTVTPAPAPTPTPAPSTPSTEDNMVRLFTHAGGVYIGVIGAWYNHVPTEGIMHFLEREGTVWNHTDGTSEVQGDVFDAMIDLGSLRLA